MSKYNSFLTMFIFSVIALIFFIGFYFNAIFSFAFRANEMSHADPLYILSAIFNAQVIISFGIAAITSLISRIIGIVYVAKNKTISDGEKALWIIGFVVMSFITSIVFLVMAKSKNFV